MEGNAFPTFTRAAQLLKGNWSLFFPGLVVGIASGSLEAVYAPRPNLTLAGGFLSLFVVVIVDVVATILVMTYTTGMAQAAWIGGRATLANGVEAVKRTPLDLLIAVACLTALGLAAAFLAPFTVGVSVAAYAYFCIYVLPSVMVGGRKGLDAVVESTEVASRRPFETGSVILALALVTSVAVGLGHLLPVRSYLAPILTQTILETTIGFVTLVVVGEYMILWGMVSAE